MIVSVRWHSSIRACGVVSGGIPSSLIAPRARRKGQGRPGTQRGPAQLPAPTQIEPTHCRPQPRCTKRPLGVLSGRANRAVPGSSQRLKGSRSGTTPRRRRGCRPGPSRCGTPQPHGSAAPGPPPPQPPSCTERGVGQIVRRTSRVRVDLPAPPAATPPRSAAAGPNRVEAIRSLVPGLSATRRTREPAAMSHEPPTPTSPDIGVVRGSPAASLPPIRW